MRAPVNRETVLRLMVEDEGGTLVPADALPTLAVTDDRTGAAIDPAPTVSEESEGVYVATLEPVEDLTLRTANWSFKASGGEYTRVTTERIVGVSDRVVPLWRYREDPELTALTARNMVRLAQKVEDWAESALGFAPVSQAFSTRWYLGGQPRAGLRIPGVSYPEDLAELTINGHALTDDELAALVFEDGAIYRGSTSNQSFLTGVPWSGGGWTPGDYAARGTQGPRPDWGGTVPTDLQDALVALGRYSAREGRNYPERATQISDESTLIMFSTPGPGRPTGLPEVDGVITRYSIQHQLG